MGSKNWLNEQLKNKRPYEKVISASYRLDGIYEANVYSWKDDEGLIWHQFKNHRPTMVFGDALLELRQDEKDTRYYMT